MGYSGFGLARGGVVVGRVWFLRVWWITSMVRKRLGFRSRVLFRFGASLMIPAQKVTNKCRTSTPTNPLIISHNSLNLYPPSAPLQLRIIFMDQSEDQPLERECDIYKRIKLLGSGSYGRAYLVREVATGQEWAVKQIDLADLSPQEQAEAMRQAKILELLRHPNIVRFREVYRTAKGRLNIVMEYAEGGDLSQRIREAKQGGRPFSEEQVLSWFVQVCLAVRHLHDSKVIHRDLKPQNIFLTADGLVKVGDFGVSKMMENTVARARTVVGSPFYLSPEIVQNRPYSFKTDIWSLGTLLFELCALQPPFSAGSLQALALKIVQGGYAQLPKQYSQGLKSLLKWMLQTKEAHRPTIHQLLLSPVVASKIHRFLAESQTAPSPRIKLKPPPDLLALEEAENRSEVIVSKKWEGREEEVAKVKAKTPQLAVRKGANNFFNRPPSSKRKPDAPADLADLIQIKPSLIEAHEKPQRMLLPKVPKSSHAVLPKPKSQIVKEKEKPLPPAAGSAFVKKRASFTQQQMKKQEVRTAAVSAKRIEKKGVPAQKEKLWFEKEKQPQNEKKKVQSKIRPQIRKKVSKPASQTKLQICSQEMKKKEARPEKKAQGKKERAQGKKERAQGKKERAQGKKERAQGKKERAQGKKERAAKGPPALPPRMQQQMQQQKCDREQQLNSNPSSYYNDDSFQSYDQEEQQVDLSLSDSPTPTANYRHMLKEMEDIQAALQEQPDALPAAGQSIPQLLEFSTYPRVDDEEEPVPPAYPRVDDEEEPVPPAYPRVDDEEEPVPSAYPRVDDEEEPVPSAYPRVDDEEEPVPPAQKREYLPQGELQSLRVNLQDIFGVENIIYAYHKIEQKIAEAGLGLDQAQTVAEIMAQRPQMQQATLLAYFRLIATIVGVEMGLL